MHKYAPKAFFTGLAAISLGAGVFSTATAAASSSPDKQPSAENTLSQRSLTEDKAVQPTKPKAQPLPERKVDKPAKPVMPKAKAAQPKAKAAQPKPAKPAKPKAIDSRKVLLSGQTRGSYFWDTGGSGNGDTGAPASGKPMHKGCFASPSWPMGTEGYIEYRGKQAKFDICDRGPGTPSHNGIMLDIDGMTYAQLTGGKWRVPYVIGGTGQAGSIPITYHVTKWGNGPGKGAPRPF